MLITSFKANNVYEYLKIDIDFNSDMTFIVGLNGSGKTTAIRLLNAILTPNLSLLNIIPFQ